MSNIFDSADCAKILERIEALSAESRPQWGKMGVAQMLAHCNVTYEMVYEDKHSKPNPIKGFILRLFIKPMVVGDKAFGRNKPTAPQFVIKDDKDFESERARLVAFIDKTQELGGGNFEGKESLSFGKLTTKEWNAMFHKHLDHHLNQFGV